MKDITAEQVLSHREEILEILKNLPSAADIEACFHKMDCKVYVEELGISGAVIPEAMARSPYVSRDITLLRLMKLFEKF